VRPIITLSVTPISIWLTCPMATGTARSSVARAFPCKQPFIAECYCEPPDEVQ
jgi:hypothetical protein